MRWIKIGVVTGLMIVMTVMMVGCGRQLTENDFELTISVDRYEVVQGESFILTATLTNVSGRTIRYWDSFREPIFWSIDGWKYGDIFALSAPPPRWWRLRNNDYIKRTFRIYAHWLYASEETGWFGVVKYQDPGIYDLSATAIFVLNWRTNNYLRISSEIIEITVLEKGGENEEN